MASVLLRRRQHSARQVAARFFVATLAEGIDLRGIDSEASIFVLNGLPSGASLEMVGARPSANPQFACGD